MSEMKILLIEDEEWYARSLLAALLEYGAGNLSGGVFNMLAPPQHVTNQADASRAASGGEFDLVILDLVYPATASANVERNLGIELLPELRRAQPRAAIVILTSHPGLESLAMVVQSIRDYQADDFVPKTADLKNEILPRLRVAWEHARSHRLTVMLKEEYRSLVRTRAARTYAEDVMALVGEVSTPLHRLASKIGQGDLAEAREAGERLQAEFEGLYQAIETLTKCLGEGKDHKTRVDVAEMLDQIKKLYEDLFKTSKARLRLSSSGPTKITTYEGDLKVALFEVTQNAVDSLEKSATSPADREVRMELSPAETGVRVSITDNGGGFSDDAIENMYKPGFTTREDGRHQG